MVPESYRWEYIRNNPEEIRRLAAETGYPEVFAGFLAARGIRNRAEAEKFLNASEKDMYSPFLMKGMDKAVERISQAVDSHEKITIYGDYDVDGITATSILYLFLKELKADVDYYLPDRMTEGYGLNTNAVRMLAESGTRLMVTVDTGISAIEECCLANNLGMEVIVTDHHECQDQLPDALAVIDAKQKDETYPFLYLAGCGVSYKLVQGLAMYRQYYGNITKYLELAAVGTVADIVPLYDENRIIVSEGFRRMKKPENRGLYKLLESAGYDFKRRITSGFVGFGLAPRLNAGGRMGDAKRGVRLFTTDDDAEASAIADELNVENNLRKETEQLILKQVTDAIDASETIRNSRVMVVAGEGWHHGVIGIVSSRIKDIYYRPNILLSIEDGVATGSARSIDGFNLFDALCTCSDLMLKFGGHAAAAGMSLKAENIPELSRRLNDYAMTHMDSRMLIPVQRPEVTLCPSDITTELIELIERMEPFGQDMPEPLVAVKGYLGEVRAVGADGNTMRMKLMDGHGSLTAVGFRRGIMKNFFHSGMNVLIAGNLGINVYMDRQYPQIILKDVRIEQPQEKEELTNFFSLRHVTQDYRNYCNGCEKIPKAVCQDVYRFLNAHSRRQGMDGEGYFLMEDVSFGSGTEKNCIYMLMQALCVFEELGLVKAESSGPYLHYTLIKGRKAKLTDSAWFNRYFEA
ncbi:MAG: single-stranded-DNA-specific exonuclease RecJ [Coprococcus sp.]